MYPKCSPSLSNFGRQYLKEEVKIRCTDGNTGLQFSLPSFRTLPISQIVPKSNMLGCNSSLFCTYFAFFIFLAKLYSLEKLVKLAINGKPLGAEKLLQTSDFYSFFMTLARSFIREASSICSPWSPLAGSQRCLLALLFTP